MLDRNFRSVPTAGFPAGVFEDAKNPLVLVNKNGMSCYATDLASKQGLLEDYELQEESEPGNQMLLFTWQGKFKSDVFEVSKDHALKILDTLNPRV